MYKLVNWIKREEYKNWEGAIIEDTKTGKQYITTGIHKWEAREERLKKCTIVDSIDFDKFFNNYHTYITSSKLEM